ncbi:MAG: triose-phosphate isomerase [Candidatus Pacebacteria bacterium]|nr:triose-phosphate isomerase [Candidatus Paceibacterota bacterium]
MKPIARPLPEKIILGNWKMNMTSTEARRWCEEFKQLPAIDNSGLWLGIAPPLTVLAEFRALVADSLLMGAQDCSALGPRGAFTGEVSAELLADAGAEFILLGHSERRRGAAAESNGLVATKLTAVQKAGLLAVLCLGESLKEREAGATESVITTQLQESLALSQRELPLAIAYEPVWAIGTGKTAEPQQISAVHQLIGQQMEGREHRILYGGSVTPANASALLRLEAVDGLLVGGASLNAASFREIVGGV